MKLNIKNFAIVVLVISIAGTVGFTFKDKSSIAPADSNKKTAPVQTSNVQTPPVQTTDTALQQNRNLQIDTSANKTPVQNVTPVDTVRKIDTASVDSISETTLTNTKLFIYIILSVLGLALFFYVFVTSLFKTFHKKKSTRQSLLLSWNLFFIVAILWIFIIWGLVAGFWTSASFTIIVIFLFIISLIMTIIAVKSK